MSLKISLFSLSRHRRLAQNYLLSPFFSHHNRATTIALTQQTEDGRRKQHLLTNMIKSTLTRSSKFSDSHPAETSRTNVFWDNVPATYPLDSGLLLSNKATSSSFRREKRGTSLNGERPCLFGEDKMERLLGLLRTNTFAGIIDPEHHLQYLWPPPTEVQRETKKCKGARPFRSLGGAFMKPWTNAHFKGSALKTKLRRLNL